MVIGPQHSSAGFPLARDVQRRGAARLLGKPTGENHRDLNGGQLAWINYRASGVGVDIPRVAAFAQWDPPIDCVLPDVVIAPNWHEAVAGIDAERATGRI